MLGAVYRAGITAPAVTGPMRETLRTAWMILAAADRERPEALDRVLAHPYVRVWAARCLEQAGLAGPAGTSDPVHRPVAAAGLGHLAAIAAATVIRAGGQADITVPVTHGAVHLPTLGRLVVSPVDPASGRAPPMQEAVFSADGKSVSIRIGRDSWEFTTADLLSGEPWGAGTFGDGGSAAWQPVRMLSAAGISVALEDTDPYRDCHRWPAATRLTEAEAAQWQQRFADAWQEIARDHPVYAPAIAAGLAVFMPMAPGTTGA